MPSNWHSLLLVLNSVVALTRAKSLYLSPLREDLRCGELLEDNAESKSEESVVAFVPTPVKVKHTIPESKGTHPTLSSSDMPKAYSTDSPSIPTFKSDDENQNRVGMLPFQYVKPAATRLQRTLKGGYGKAAEGLTRIGTASWENLWITPNNIHIRNTAERVKEESLKVLNKVLGCTLMLRQRIGSPLSKPKGNPNIVVPVVAFALLGSSLGFHSFLYFVSVGYSISIGLMSLSTLILVNVSIRKSFNHYQCFAYPTCATYLSISRLFTKQMSLFYPTSTLY